MNALEVRGLSKRYAGFSLQNVSFTLPAGSIMGFIGENGAGKTTTLKLILNLIARDAGEVKIFGLDARSNELSIKQQLGVVFDQSFFHDSLRVSDIASILRPIYRAWDDGTWKRFLDRFSIPAEKTMKELSRGMKMKLSIAAAMSHAPKLLLFDEATSGLDPIVRDEILDLLLEFIQDEQHAVLLSSHIISDLEKVSDYITFLHRGAVVFSDSKDALLDRYGLLKCGREDESKLDRADLCALRRSDFGCEALVRDRTAARRKYPGALVERASIEDIMLMMIKNGLK